MNWVSYRRASDEVRALAQLGRLQVTYCEGEGASRTTLQTTAARQARLRLASRQPSRRVVINRGGDSTG